MFCVKDFSFITELKYIATVFCYHDYLNPLLGKLSQVFVIANLNFYIKPFKILNMKNNFFFTVMFLIGITSITCGQEYAVDKGATFIAGTFSLMSQGGDMFLDSDNNKVTTITLTPSINHFVTKNFFIGGGIELSNESQGDYSSKSIGLGPQIGVAFGNINSKAFPYIDLGLRYYSMNMDFGGSYGKSQTSGSDLILGCGVLIPIKSHIGLVFEGGYHMLNLKDKDVNSKYSGKILSLAVGIVGILF